ncbi:protein-L-isoaspartate(D-aspartate) O-methyltransferase [Azohydromonas lata]|uniref:Protein-L-isoaspartate O-methyltransferase n=1 Tax=Azohydromonas lata TaxID=45677 RepID=A0ABU5IJC4_9BURK|nr:protein-L-isoaspartate(D-aspartate) O-methyltransferase [Azohydromonas lata]MDZ5458995.1 protein-L-isoaspartate(D-aspartate) O-methyltransferase [Azohydromonas lata]
MKPRGPRFPIGLDRVSPGAQAPGTTQRPQRPVHEAAADARRRSAPIGLPSGLGLDSVAVRARMVQRLRAQGLLCEPVLQALEQVPRHHFVDPALVAQAYEDTALPIGHGQTISKPSVVARMLALLFEGRSARQRGSLGRVLEIGTGSGYQAALLGVLGTQVISVERLRPLHERARTLLQPLRRANMRLVWADGCQGHPPNAPYDTVIAAAGGEALPQSWLDQMAPGARLVAPLHTRAAGGQVLMVVDRTETDWVRQVHEAVHFVPLKSGLG